jgi:DNA processing protein
MNSSFVSDLLKLSFVPLISSTRLRNLVKYFKDTSLIFKADFENLLKVEMINEKSAKNIKEFDFDKIQPKIDEQFKIIEKLKVKVTTFWDENYPERLKNIAYPPALLFIRGNELILKEKSLAIVGTRSPTKYGIESAKYFAANLVKSGITITSGLAYGIDTIAHLTAINEKGKTIAVLGTGVDIIYPKDNSKLAEKIIDEGVLVSEYMLKTAPATQNFPARNRIIAGLSLGVLLVESDNDGGGIITARFALDEGTSVFAVPGNINAKKSRGTNRLIKNCEAKLVQNSDDILCELNLKSGPKKETLHNLDNLTEMQKKIIALLATEITHVDKISDECGLNPSETLVTLLNLELEGLIRKLPGNYYQIVE